jgi:hypothetical protein
MLVWGGEVWEPKCAKEPNSEFANSGCNGGNSISFFLSIHFNINKNQLSESAHDKENRQMNRGKQESNISLLIFRSNKLGATLVILGV